MMNICYLTFNKDICHNNQKDSEHDHDDLGNNVKRRFAKFLWILHRILQNASYLFFFVYFPEPSLAVSLFNVDQY